MLLTNSPPGDKGVGQNYMRDVFACAPFRKTGCCAVLRDPNDWDVKTAGIDYVFTLTQKYESAFRPKIGGGFVAATALRVKSIRYAKLQASRAIGFAQGLRTKDILVVLESPQMMLMGDWIARNSDLRVHTLVWDHPEHVVASFGHQGASKRLLLAAFHRCLAASQSIMTVADGLKDYLSDKNPAATCTAIRSPVSQPNIAETPEANTFVVGMAGSVTAPSEFERLQVALDECGWAIAGKRIVLRLFGYRYVLSARAARNVQYRGFLRTTADVIQALSECDACFLPQPFDQARRNVAEFSFPTKFSTYLASGRPVIVHAPSFASIPRFIKARASENRSGLISTTEDSQSVVALIKRMIQEPDFRDQQYAATSDLQSTDFSIETCRAELQKHFGV